MSLRLLNVCLVFSLHQLEVGIKRLTIPFQVLEVIKLLEVISEGKVE